ncbi:Methyltransferase domain containing protein [Ceratobasidium theobromae]|uniref:Methyltransferase domain containing protein n=1 Tax=Ceratobasidium theobromae TaxID=1582974 RepID=A0A5N5QBZ5_9AGAM|nr:Methyltransferase domain containing protein [Ceratobasidium theobromae]
MCHSYTSGPLPEGILNSLVLSPVYPFDSPSSPSAVSDMPAYPFFDPETEGLVYRVTSNTHMYQESLSDVTSEAESAISGLTIQSDDLHEYFVEHHGRQHPAGESAVRWFPSDNTRRYILRHVLNKYLYGRNYFGPVGEILRFAPGRRYKVLELGTRDGTWIQEMATEFPHVQFRSLDIVPIIAHAPRPNIVFEAYDFTRGLLQEDSSQDIVFLNVAMELVKDYRALLLEAHRVLKPGGLIHIREYNLQLWDPQDPSEPVGGANPASSRLISTARRALSKSGVDPDICDRLPQWLTPNSDLWKHLGPNQARGFERISSTTRVFPAYPHERHACSFKIDPFMVSIMAHYVVMTVRDMYGILRDGGLEVDEANGLIDAMVEELKNPEKCMLAKLHCTYAMKKS